MLKNKPKRKIFVSGQKLKCPKNRTLKIGMRFMGRLRKRHPVCRKVKPPVSLRVVRKVKSPVCLRVVPFGSELFYPDAVNKYKFKYKHK